jgi:hypothetical protein
MKIAFEFSARDMADAADRSLTRSKVVRDWHWQFIAFYAVVVGLLVFALTPGPMLGRAVFAALVAIVIALYYRKKPQPSLQSIAYYREQLGGDGPFTCEVEITPEGLVTRQFGVEATHDWRYVRSVVEVTDGIEFTYIPTGALLVRDRGFPTPEQKREFLALAKQFVRSGT